MRWTFTLLLSIGMITSASANENWPAFRGGAQAGVAEGKTLPATWSKDKNVVWSQVIPGRGWSSPIVWGERIFLTTTISETDLGEPQKGLYINDLTGKIRPGEHRWVVMCLDRKTGKTLWQKNAHEGKAPGPIHKKNSYASETPVTDGERVYAYFGNLGVYCYDMEGKQLWSKSMEPARTTLNWGTAASPALHKDQLIIQNDNDDESWLMSLNAKTGKLNWRVKREEKSNWATPFIWENKLRTEIITAGKNKVRSYDLKGKLLWELHGMSSPTIPTPFAAHGLLFVTSGYVIDFTRPLYAIRPGAKGDITLKSKEKTNKFVAWSSTLAGPYHPTPVVYGDYLYVLLDRGQIACYNAKTGERVYKERIPRAGTGFTASPWAYDGKIFCLNEDGTTIVIKAGAEFKVLGRNSLDGTSLATPALAGGSLFIRTINRLYRLEKK